MSIFLKYIIRSMLEKKLRFMLFLLSIAVATGLFLASMGIVDVAVEAIGGQVSKTSENRDIRIQSNQADPYFSLDGLQLAGVENMQASLVLPSITQDLNYEFVQIHGRHLDSLEDYVYADESTHPFENNRIYISMRTAALHSLALGDELTLLIANDKHTFTIAGIIVNDGIFYTDTTARFNVVIPYETLAALLDVTSLYNTVYADGSEKTIEASIERFNAENDAFRASPVYDEGIIEGMIAGQRNIFYFMLGFVLLVSMVILYGSFKLIITERTMVIGVFFSQGATKKDVKRILYIESILYGVFGGVLGTILGLLLLFFAHRFISPLYEYGIYEPFTFNPIILLYALIFSVSFSLFSCYMPIRKIGRYQIREVILGELENQKSLKKPLFLIGMGCILTSSLIVFLFADLAVILAPLLMLISLFGLLLSYPYLLSFAIKKVFKPIYGKWSFTALSINNIRTSRALRGNISILIIALIAVLSVITISKGTERIVAEAYTTLHFDIMVENIQTDDPETMDAIMQDLKNNTDIKPESINQKATVLGSNDGEYAMIEGIDPQIFEALLTYLDFTQADGSNAIETLMDPQQLHTVIAKNTAARLNLDVGDRTPITINGITEHYTVTGIVDGKLWMQGDFFMMNIVTLNTNHQVRNATIYFMVNGDLDDLIAGFKEDFRHYGATVMTHREMQELNQEQNQLMFNILNYFSLFAVLVGAFGAINNMIISFLQRKREFAVLQSIGGTAPQTRKLLFFESIFTVLFSALIVSLFMYLFTKILAKVVASIGLPMDLSFTLSDAVPFLILSIVIYLVATVPLLYKSRKLSIMQEMRFE